MISVAIDGPAGAGKSTLARRLAADAYTGGYNLQIAFCTAQSFANHLE